MAVLPYIGETIWGFTATQLGTIGMLGAETVEFLHGTSGARLLHIRNDDQELGCNIIFRTPQKDETDANHVLEHLILSSCRKYPSRDIFFDMDSKSYSTFMNGLTDNAYTSYPLCTQSQEQLIKLMDVFLCCMESPDFLRERNFFLREGVRFELESPEGPLTLQGTVLSEDWGHLTDLQENADSFTAKTLYPGMEASNLLGRAHLHYRELNYEQVQAAFYRNYRYSNCLIVLYGNMEYKRILEFLHKRHLSARQADPGQRRIRLLHPRAGTRTQEMHLPKPRLQGYSHGTGGSYRLRHRPVPQHPGGAGILGFICRSDGSRRLPLAQICQGTGT